MARRFHQSKLDKTTKKIVEVYTISHLDGHDLVVLDEALRHLFDMNTDDPMLDEWKEAALADLREIVGDMIGEIGEKGNG